MTFFPLGWQVLAAAALDGGLAVAVGVVVLRGRIARAQIARLEVATGLWLLGASIAYAAAASLAMTDVAVGDLPQAMGLVLLHTRFGRAMWGLGAGGLLFLSALACPCKGGVRRIVFAVAALATVLARATTGHAADGGWTSAALWIHGGHLLATAAWTGVVFVAIAATRRHRGVTPALARRISVVSTWALAGAVGAGVVNALSLFGAARAPLDGAYALWLAGKLGFVVFAVALGAFNRWTRLPRLCEGDAEAGASFRRILAVEAIVLILVIVLAACLGVAMPPD